jgi:predicted O-methyltransferase YrrM
MKKANRQLFIIWQYLKYLLKARHWKGHGIHSPYVFELVNKVMYDKTNYKDYDFFREIRRKLKDSEIKLQVENAGADSAYFTSGERNIRDLLRISSVKPKFGKLLYRIVRHYKPATIIELGTSIGLSTIYLARGNERANVITIEKSHTLCRFASETFREIGIMNVSVKNGLFDDKLDELGDSIFESALIFIDGNHKFESTLAYFNFFAERMKEGIIILDDIHWSREMLRAWETIRQKEESQATLNLFSMGFVVRRPSITRKNYTVLF